MLTGYLKFFTSRVTKAVPERRAAGVGQHCSCCVARMWGVGTQQPPCGQFILSVCRGRRGLLNLVFYKPLFNVCFLFLKSLCSSYFPHTPPHKQKLLSKFSFGKLYHDSLVDLVLYT
ncbi:UNVERIFIED_CONTAM: hypothetical protein K2H54_074642 [Gekko kuhli]